MILIIIQLIVASYMLYVMVDMKNKSQPRLHNFMIGLVAVSILAGLFSLILV